MNGLDARVFYKMAIAFLVMLIPFLMMASGDYLANAIMLFIFFACFSSMFGYLLSTKLKELKRIGQKVPAKYLGVCSYYKTLRSGWYRIVCEWVDSNGEKHLFVSSALSKRAFNKFTPVEFIDVYLDDKTGNYYVDLSSAK